MKIFVARHGETAQNRAQVMQRPEDPPSDHPPNGESAPTFTDLGEGGAPQSAPV